MTQEAGTAAGALVPVINRMVELLSKYGEDTWANALRDCAARHEAEDARPILRGMYGGMGSLNDLVLHSSDLPGMRADNTEFDRLRSKLFELCR